MLYLRKDNSNLEDRESSIATNYKVGIDSFQLSNTNKTIKEKRTKKEENRKRRWKEGKYPAEFNRAPMQLSDIRRDSQKYIVKL